MTAVKNGSLSIVKQIVEIAKLKNIDWKVCRRGKDNNTLLTWAIWNRQFEIVDYLLDNGVYTEETNMYGENAVTICKNMIKKEAKTIPTGAKERTKNFTNIINKINDIHRNQEQMNSRKNLQKYQ